MSQPLLSGLQGSGVGVPYPICTLSACAPQECISLGSLGAGQDSEDKANPPLVNDLSAQVCGLAKMGSEGAREEPAGAPAWHPAPSSKALACHGCSCAKALVSSCPRLGAEHALGLCHEAVGNFATVSRRAEQEEGASPQSPSLSPSLLLTLRKP